MGFFKDLKKRAKSIKPMPAPIPQEMSLPSIKPGVLDKRISSALLERPSPIPQGMSLDPISLPRFKLEKRISDMNGIIDLTKKDIELIHKQNEEIEINKNIII